MAKAKAYRSGHQPPKQAGTWRGGVPTANAGSVTGYTPTPGRKRPGPAVQGASTANTGDGTPVNGHNTPRGTVYANHPAQGIVSRTKPNRKGM